MGKQGGKGKGKNMYRVDTTGACFFRRVRPGSIVTSLLSHIRSEI